MQLTLDAWWLLALAWPVLLMGEMIVRRIPVLARFNVPVAVAGGLFFAGMTLLLGTAGIAQISFQTKVSAGWWTWLITPETEWIGRPAKNLNLPLLVGFFTCIGLGAPLRVLRTGGRVLLVLVGATTLLAVLQNAAGAAMAAALQVPPLLGVVCGSLSLVGGVGTTLGFASTFEAAGFPTATTIGLGASTFGLVAGGVLAGPLAEWLLRRRGLPPPLNERDGGVPRSSIATFAGDLRALLGFGPAVWPHVLVLGVCIKIGVWLNLALESLGATLPAYMGALLVGLAVRAGHDGVGATWLRDEVIARLAALLLAMFLAVTLAPLNLVELASVAGPMLVILCVNVVISLLFAALVVWPLLGRNYEAAVMVAGLVGFGVGSTGTAVAAMDAMVRRRGPAPRAFAFIPPTGGFLIDFTNAPVIGAFIRLLR